MGQWQCFVSEKSFQNSITNKKFIYSRKSSSHQNRKKNVWNDIIKCGNNLVCRSKWFYCEVLLLVIRKTVIKQQLKWSDQGPGVIMCTWNEVVRSGGDISGRVAGRCFVMSIYVFSNLYTAQYIALLPHVWPNRLRSATVSIRMKWAHWSHKSTSAHTQLFTGRPQFNEIQMAPLSNGTRVTITLLIHNP